MAEDLAPVPRAADAAHEAAGLEAVDEARDAGALLDHPRGDLQGGEALLAGLDGKVAEAARRLLAPLDPARTAELVRLLDAVRATTASPPGTIPEEERRAKKKRK